MLTRAFREVSILRSSALMMAVASLFIVATGCSFAGPAKQILTVNVENDPEAQIRVDGQYIGKQSISHEVAVNKNHVVRVEASDGQIVTRKVNKRLSEFGILDIIGGVFFLVPFVGIAAPGFWKLDEDTISVRVPEPTSGGYAP